MAAGINDKFAATFNSANPNVATVTATRTAAATTLQCDDLSGWPTATVVHFSTYQINTSNEVVAGTQIDWKGIVSGNNIGSLTRVAGATDAGNTIGDVVEMNPTASWADDLVDGILAEHEQDGTHGDVTATSVTSTGAVEGTGFTVTGQTTGLLGAIHRYTYDGTDIFVDGVDQNNAANTINWTKPTNLKFVIVETVGGGGGGGGVSGASGGNSSFGRGGGGGGYSRSKVLAASLGSTETVTVGAGGTAASAGNNTGGNGGNSSFGSHVVANGGSGGAGGGSGSTVAIAGSNNGGTAGTGDLALPGGDSKPLMRISSTLGVEGGGGDAGGGMGHGAYQNGVAKSGLTGGNYGGGGSGGFDSASSTNRAGGAGAPGIVIVYEYF